MTVVSKSRGIIVDYVSVGLMDLMIENGYDSDSPSQIRIFREIPTPLPAFLRLVFSLHGITIFLATQNSNPLPYRCGPNHSFQNF